MNPLLPARVAARYLTARKSHSAVGALAAVSVVGVAIATAAIVCVLSVFNGFRDVLGGQLDRMSPDVLVEPVHGKVIARADSLADAIASMPGVALASPVLADQALALLDGAELPIVLKGVVESDYPHLAQLDSLLVAGGSELSRPAAEGEQTLEYDPDLGIYIASDEPADKPMGVLGIGAANRLRAQVGQNVLIFAPRRVGRINPAAPASSFMRDSIGVAGVFRTDNTGADASTVIVGIDVARRIFQYTDEASSIEVGAARGTDAAALAAAIGRTLGPDFRVRDRMAQHEIHFRMVRIEKWITFLLLSFILLIASFNVISTLSMLVIEKRGAMLPLRAVGMTRGAIAAIFAWESVFVTAIGFVAGATLGLLLCVLQQRFGLIRLSADPSTLLMSAYPVSIEWSDLLLVLAPTLAIGAAAAFITSRFARSRIPV